jgi:AraC family transcriptional regulator
MPYRNFAGDAERVRQAGGFSISTTVHRSHSALGHHRHERAYFCYVISGQFEERSRARTGRHGAETLLYHPPGSGHADRFEAATRCLNVEMPVDWNPLPEPLAAAFTRAEERRELRLTSIARRLQEELRVDDSASPLALQGLALELCAEWSRVEDPDRSPPWLIEAERILRAECQRPIAFRALAERVGVHPVQLSRVFHRRRGMTMTRFLIELRVEHAARLLASGNLSLAAVAADAGFADQSHLAKSFRRYRGTTCGRYRSRLGRPR